MSVLKKNSSYNDARVPDPGAPHNIYMTLSPEQKRLLPNALKEVTENTIAHSKAREELLTLSQLEILLLPVFDDVAATLHTTHLGYVSGLISGEGDHKIEENLAILQEWTDKVRETQDFPIFGPPDIFNHQMYAILQELKLNRSKREPLFNEFWHSIISTKVTHIFMTPKWESGKGTWLELEAAQEKGAVVHYL